MWVAVHEFADRVVGPFETSEAAISWIFKQDAPIAWRVVLVRPEPWLDRDGLERTEFLD